MDLKVYTLWGYTLIKKGRNTQVIKCCPWETEVKPFPLLQKKMVEFLRCRQIIAMPFANRSYQPRTKTTATRRCNLVTLTRPNRKKLSQPRKVNIGPLLKATQRNWPAMLKAKEVADTSQAPTSSQPMEASLMQCPTSPIPPNPEHTKYCSICTPLWKICPNEYLVFELG